MALPTTRGSSAKALFEVCYTSQPRIVDLSQGRTQTCLLGQTCAEFPAKPTADQQVPSPSYEAFISRETCGYTSDHAIEIFSLGAKKRRPSQHGAEYAAGSPSLLYRYFVTILNSRMMLHIKDRQVQTLTSIGTVHDVD